MNKNLLSLILAGVMLLSLAACGSAVSTPATPVPAPEAAAATPTEIPEESAELPGEEAPAPAETGKGALVIYFSRTGEQYTVGVIEKGNTAIVAEMVAEKTGADLFEVLPAEDNYPMTYDALLDVARQEQRDKARPAYKGALPDLTAYDTVFIGAPVWWGDWPMILYTVFENNVFSGKRLVPFSTHEGSGLSGFDRKLAAVCPDSEILTGLAVRGNDAQNRPDAVRESVNGWLAGLGY